MEIDEEENSKEYTLPYWRQVEIAEQCVSLFTEMLQGGTENILQRAMEKLGIVPIPYAKLSKRKKDVQELLGEYGFIFQPVNGVRMFFFNQHTPTQSIGVCRSHKVSQSGFIPFIATQSVGVSNPPHE